MRKLGKFIRLVQNEYIKILKKVSTWIMLILILVVCVGYFGVSKIAEYQVKNNRYEMSEQDRKEQLNSNLTYAKETKYEGWEADVADTSSAWIMRSSSTTGAGRLSPLFFTRCRMQPLRNL